jgi:hypothetical protein
MKYKVIDVRSSKELYSPGGTLQGTEYHAIYEVEYWSWLKFKTVTDIKHCFKRPYGVLFRDSYTGETIPSNVDSLIYAYIHLKNL